MLRFIRSLAIPPFRNYWAYSIGSGIAWAITFTLMRKIRGKQDAQLLLLVIFGWCICWVSATIARYLYPPPKFWRSN